MVESWNFLSGRSWILFSILKHSFNRTLPSPPCSYSFPHTGYIHSHNTHSLFGPHLLSLSLLFSSPPTHFPLHVHPFPPSDALALLPHDTHSFLCSSFTPSFLFFPSPCFLLPSSPLCSVEVVVAVGGYLDRRTCHVGNWPMVLFPVSSWRVWRPTPLYCWRCLETSRIQRGGCVCKWDGRTDGQPKIY